MSEHGEPRADANREPRDRPRPPRARRGGPGRRRCTECRGEGRLPGMVRTEGHSMGSKFGFCPTCDGLGYLVDDTGADAARPD